MAAVDEDPAIRTTVQHGDQWVVTASDDDERVIGHVRKVRGGYQGTTDTRGRIWLPTIYKAPLDAAAGVRAAWRGRHG